MTRRRLASLAVVVFGALAAAAPASADDVPPVGDEAPERRAARAFAAGQEAFAAADFRRAALAFEEAYAAKRHHAALWNAARSWQRAGEELRAAMRLDEYLAEAPAVAPDRDEATAALAASLKSVGRIEVRLGADVGSAALDGEPAHASGRPIIVAPGEHVVSAVDARGRALQRFVRVNSGEVVRVLLGPEEAPAEEPKSRERVSPSVVGGGASRSLSPWFVVGGSALTLAGVGLTTLFGLDTIGKRDAFLADRTSQQKLDDGNDSQTRTNVALGATIGLAVVTGLVATLFVDWRGSSPRASAAGRQ